MVHHFCHGYSVNGEKQNAINTQHLELVPERHPEFIS